jgi:hypothetical protein
LECDFAGPIASRGRVGYRFGKSLKLAVQRDEGHLPKRSPRIRARTKTHVIQPSRPTVLIGIPSEYTAKLVGLKNRRELLMNRVVEFFGPEQQFYTSWKSECLKPIPRVGFGHRWRQQLQFKANPWTRVPRIEDNSLVRERLITTGK